MANSTGPVSLDLLTTTAIDYLRTESALIDRVYKETRQQKDLREGVKTVQVRKPGGALAPIAFSSNTTNDITLTTTPLTFDQHFKIHFNMSELESRTINGNFAQAFQDSIAGGLDGIANKIDQQLTALVKSCTANAAVGTAGTLVADTTIRAALKQLEKKNVKAKDCSAVLSVDNWWDGLLNETKYVNNLNSPVGADILSQAVIPGLYGMRDVVRSNNIEFVAGAPGHAENVILDKYGLMIGFLEFESAATYGAPNVEEEIFTDPVTGISLRAQRWYDVTSASWNARIDVCWGVAILDQNRVQRVLGI